MDDGDCGGPLTSTIASVRFGRADGLSLAADVGGDPRAPAVILLHGGGQTRHSWGKALGELVAHGYHVISLDARGHGDSDWSNDADYGLDALSSDLRCVIATLPAAPALVGASLGGATALYTVGNASEQIASALVLVDIVPRVERVGAQRIYAFMRAHEEGFDTFEQAVNAVAEYYPHRPRPMDPSGLMKNLRLRGDGRLHWHWDPKIIQYPRRLEPPQFAEVLEQAATRVAIPSLLVRGLHSDIVSDEGVAALIRRLPALEVLDVGDAGHMVAGDKNDAFNQGVVEFLRRHFPVRLSG
jgi:pimeloyl-ACP methyl ester carboxylesterase